jgi:hypothetical protein
MLHAVEEIRADLVHLVDEDDARHLVAVGLAPDGFGLRLDAGVGIEQADRAVEHGERALHLDGEVDVAGGVDDVEAVELGVGAPRRVGIFLALPEGRGRGRGDGDAALLLLLHPVHGRGAVMHLAHLVRLAGVEQDTLGRRGLAGVDMRHDPEVAVALRGYSRAIGFGPQA